MSSYFPFRVFDELQRDMSRYGYPGDRSWQPPVDIVENDEAWLLSMDIPGVDRDAIDITVEKEVLTVRAERRIDYGDNRSALRERRDGEFSRQFRLPEVVDADNIAARFENGVLTLQLPRLIKPEPRRISVQ